MNPVCEVCGSTEIWHFYRDIREIEPEKDRDGILWARFEAIPNTEHYFCKQHWDGKGGKVIRLKDNHE